jgi:hypothetical protein
VLVGWIGVIDHVFDGSVYNELVSEPWIHLGNELIDSLLNAHFTDNLSFNGVAKIILSVLEIAALHILFNILNRAAIMIIEDVYNAILVKKWDINNVI